MPAVFFQMSNEQNALLKKLMAQDGYTSKAEFFRFLLKLHEYRRMDKKEVEQELERLTGSIGKILKELDKRGMIDTRPLREQMQDLEKEELENSNAPNSLH